MADKIVYSFQKNSTDVIGFSLGNYKGVDLADIRIYFKDSEGNLKPTPKGISLRVESFNELKAGVDALKKALQQDKKDEASDTTETN